MDFKQLAGCIVADKNSKKLGKIIRIDNLTGKTVKKLKQKQQKRVSNTTQKTAKTKTMRLKKGRVNTCQSFAFGKGTKNR